MLLLGAVAFASCTPAEVSPALEISVTSNAFLMQGIEYRSKSELTAVLKTMKPPAAISLHQEPNITADRRAEVLAAISEAGIKAPVAIVGNEVFSK